MPYANPEDQKPASRKHYRENKAVYIERAKAERERKRAFLREMKDGSCTDCGQRYPHYVMDFDHRDPSQKSFGPARIVDYGWAKAKAELAKCDLVCANCHRERTFGSLER